MRENTRETRTREKRECERTERTQEKRECERTENARETRTQVYSNYSNIESMVVEDESFY